MMTKIINVSSALKVFEEVANLHGLATEQGDYKVANKNYHRIVKSISYLKEHDLMDSLLNYICHSSIGVKMWAATYLLPKHERESLKCLEEIGSIKGIHSLTAKTTLSEWKRGNLKL